MPRTGWGPPEDAYATALGLGEHSLLAQQVVDRTLVVGAALNAASRDRAELNQAASIVP